ncbi:class I SAM-dependent DNA methyltransferase [Hyphomonas adhaerens]|uniref:class I SAM-dependent DNA methyltransferase n=1 Tax=Hyphomonas adhaerens TaxID=81029 RepID=UPI002353D84B|nr:DNA methyltransferase [Hyphomonas adhaerens]
MNAVEIEEAISELAEQEFDAQAFPYAFLEAFGNKATTIQRLKSGATNKSDLDGVLQTNNIHIKVCPPGEVTQTLIALKESPATARAKAKFVLATDGVDFEAEDLASGENVACPFPDFPDHFGFFLPLAGITTVQQIRENAFDIRATSKLNKLYVELLKDNPDWGTSARRPEMNHFMARLIFCFFAEDTDIFDGSGLFTNTIDQMSARDGSNTAAIISEIFRAMNTKSSDRASGNFRNWADKFPYVNGGLFSGSTDVPNFSKIARSYLIHIGNLDWKRINPDIFGSMIQAVADDDERGALGMHYTSVPNILKVLNPLFLDDLREKLEEAGDNSRKLLNLRNRMARIRVFDPACGSGNFLVIAYKEMRAIEAEINKRRGEPDRRTDIPLTNFRGIELRDFPAEIARLALIIAEFQCDVLYRGQKEALAEFLPLDAMNWITCGNALRLDWLSICPPTGTGVKLQSDDLLETPLDQVQIDFENEGGETYICGNPPYVGSSIQTRAQKSELEAIFAPVLKSWKNIDYIAGWFYKAAVFSQAVQCDFAFVSTNSICQGQQVPLLWPLLYDMGARIHFAHLSFKWSNLAAHNAGVTVVIVGVTSTSSKSSALFSIGPEGETAVRNVENINPYLVPGQNLVVEAVSRPTDERSLMVKGNMPSDGGNLIISNDQRHLILRNNPEASEFILKYCGSHEFINGEFRYCLWIEDNDFERAAQIPEISSRLDKVAEFRRNAKAATTRPYAEFPHRFRQIQDVALERSIIVPRHSSENRYYLPVGILSSDSIISDSALVIYDAPLWNISVIASRIHQAWVATVCGKLETRYRYSNTLGWNAFPIPRLTEKNKADLDICAQDILLAREAHFPATIADLYEPENMPENLRAAHERNDEVLERIYIGRRFKNDTERLEVLFELYTKMTSGGTRR